MHDAVQVFRSLNIAAYIALAGLALVLFRRRRDRAAMWTACAFGALGLLEILSLIPNHQRNLGESALVRVEIALLVLFPFLLFRFTSVFRPAGRDLANGLLGLTAILLAWTFAMPRIPQANEARPVWFTAFVVVFLLHWSVLSVLTAVRLTTAGRRQPAVARRRMRMLAAAAVLITFAIFLVAASGSDRYSAVVLASQLLGLVSALTFSLGLAPPALVRMAWRAPEQARLQDALTRLLRFAETEEEVAGRVLEPAAALVGAKAIAIRDGGGRIVGAWNVPSETRDALERRSPEVPTPVRDHTLVELDLEGGSLVVWTSPYAPFFGEEELALLRTLGVLTQVAIERVRFFREEREARLALERADELKTNFVAMAAHELRTPMTTIHGFATTLHHLGSRLDTAQRAQLREALLEQTQRMARLIEQLLDLSRLDADAVAIVPRPLELRSVVEEVVTGTAPDPDAVRVEIRPDLVVDADREALERVLTNLVTNAFRYGLPPVVVRGEQRDGLFELSVEDAGAGVPPDFVPDLFERFARSESSRARPGGTGLGLAIARSYALAHGGDLVYEAAEPHGARFSLLLPTRASLLPNGSAAATLSR